jgi:iron complex outermembrane receptor protein
MLRPKAAAYICAVLAPAFVPTFALASDATTTGDTLQEITVTAEKQTENLQETAAAVTAISSDQLLAQGVTDLISAEKLVPSARFQAEANNTQVIVRGVGSVLDQPNVEPNVAFNLAGIYLPREADSSAFFDLQQMEVLPGSQGTLYGRSAIGGTINLTPTRPGFNDDGMSLLEVGNYSAVHALVTQNLKASDSVALRAAVDYAYNDGFEVTGADSKNDISARLSAIINPTDQLTAYLWVQGAQKHGYTENLVNKGTDPTDGKYCETCFFYPNDPWNDTRTGAFAEPYGTPDRAKNHYETYVVGGQIDYDFGGAVLSYLPSYLYLDSAPEYWLSAIDTINTDHFNQVTQELRLASKGDGPFKWLAGLYYFNSRNSGLFSLFINEPFALYQSNVAADRLAGEAAYGQLTYSVTDSTRVTGGARISTTSRTANGLEVVALGGLPYTFDKTYTHADWKIGVEQDLERGVMAYATIQTGYEPGTFNELPNTATFSNEVKPQRLTAYTVGLKSRWLDDRLQINDEIFYYDYRDLLIQSYDIALPYNDVFNAAKVAIKGDQLDVLALVFTQDQFNANLGYSHARNVDFITPQGGNYDGLQLAYAPDFTATTGYTHNIPLGQAMLRAHLDWSWQSSWYGDYVHNKGVEQDAYSKGDASLTYDASKWTFGLWVKNMTNRVVIAATAAAGVPGPATSYLDDPRTYGIRFTVKY